MKLIMNEYFIQSDALCQKERGKEKQIQKLDARGKD